MSQSAIAIDVGYGYVKAINMLREKISFPSVMAPSTNDPLKGLFGNGQKYKVRIKRMDNKPQEILVGDAALQSMAATATLTREKPAEVHDAMLLSAAYLAGAGDTGPFPKQTDIAVGLPLAYFKSQKETLERRLKSLSAWVSVNDGPEKNISFRRVLVLPQGAGVMLSKICSPESDYLAVVDIGTYTTDYLLFENRAGVPVPVPEACGSLEMGVHLVHRALAAEFQELTGAPLAPRMYQKALNAALANKTIRFNGKDIQLSEICRKALNDTAQAIIQSVLLSWGDRTGYIGLTILAGGGTYLFKDDMLKALPDAKLADDPVFANAEGFLDLLCGND